MESTLYSRATAHSSNILSRLLTVSISDLFLQAGSSLLESEDLFNSSYVPNNPSLVLDTALWKTGESNPDPNNTEEPSPLVHLQPILVDLNVNNNNDENFFLTSEEGKKLYFITFPALDLFSL